MKLDTATVSRIKQAIVEKRKQEDIAKEFGISRSLVSDIATCRRHNKVPWPAEPPVKRAGGQRKPITDHDPTNRRILELESEVLHLTEERNTERKRVKASAKSEGLFRAIVDEMDKRIVPLKPIDRPAFLPKKGAIEEHVVMHLSDGHHDQVVTLEESGGLEQYDFPISCARAERYVDTVIEWCHDTLSPKFDFRTLWIPAYGDHTSGEIHGHGNRSYYRNQFRNCFAIGQLHSLMFRDLAKWFDSINVLYLSGNHGRRSKEKDYHGAQDNFDYLVGEVARLHCRDIPRINFMLPNAYSANLNINGVGFNFSHGDDVRGNLGIPFYGMVRRQKGLIALSAKQGGPPIRYFCMGHHHVAASLSDIDGEMLVNGAWVGTDSYAFNAFSGYREPVQLLHGVNPKYGVTWRMNVKLKDASELKGPKRYKIDGGRDVGPLMEG
jgi:hypothetical protein